MKLLKLAVEFVNAVKKERDNAVGLKAQIKELESYIKVLEGKLGEHSTAVDKVFQVIEEGLSYTPVADAIVVLANDEAAAQVEGTAAENPGMLVNSEITDEETANAAIAAVVESVAEDAGVALPHEEVAEAIAAA